MIKTDHNTRLLKFRVRNFSGSDEAQCYGDYFIYYTSKSRSKLMTGILSKVR